MLLPISLQIVNDAVIGSQPLTLRRNDLFACVPAVKFQKALAWQGAEMDLDGVECVVANLIYRKLVKGYLSHQHRIAVLSKQEPFPPLSLATLTEP